MTDVPTTFDNDSPLDDDGDRMLLRGESFEDTEMDITPMIDITFLLLIFFLVASKMDEAAEIPLAKADYGIAIPENESIVLMIRKGTGENAEVSDGHGNEYSSDLQTQEDQVAKYVRDGLVGEGDFGGNQKTRVMVKAEQDARHGEVSRILEAVGRGKKDADSDLSKVNIAILEEG